MSLPARRSCLYCGVTESPHNEQLKRCSRCKAAYYCTSHHQTRHWEQHREWCYQRDLPRDRWWEKEHLCASCDRRHPWKETCGRCEAHEEVHEGELELVIWPYREDELQLGWGGAETDEACHLRVIFAKEFGSCEERFAEFRESAFRWTCCGSSLLEGTRGCNHHGTASYPCTCLFCENARPLPKSLRRHTQTSYGLQLNCGPDLRSFCMHSLLQRLAMVEGRVSSSEDDEEWELESLP